MLYQIIIVLHGLIGFCIIGLVLIQQGKGADAGAAFGSGASGSVFGAQGSASFLSRTTAILAACFFTTSLTLAVLSGHQGKKANLIDAISSEESRTETVPAAADVPVAPAQSAASQAPAEPQATTLPAAPAIKEVQQSAPAKSSNAQ